MNPSYSQEQARKRRKLEKHLASQWARRRQQPESVVRKTAAALQKLGAHAAAEADRRAYELALAFLAAQKSCNAHSPPVCSMPCGAAGRSQR